jgi:hypothetical protein
VFQTGLFQKLAKIFGENNSWVESADAVPDRKDGEGGVGPCLGRCYPFGAASVKVRSDRHKRRVVGQFEFSIIRVQGWMPVFAGMTAVDSTW